jgi:hypothetical protein
MIAALTAPDDVKGMPLLYVASGPVETHKAPPDDGRPFVQTVSAGKPLTVVSK